MRTRKRLKERVHFLPPLSLLPSSSSYNRSPFFSSPFLSIYPISFTPSFFINIPLAFSVTLVSISPFSLPPFIWWPILYFTPFCHSTHLLIYPISSPRLSSIRLPLHCCSLYLPCTPGISLTLPLLLSLPIPTLCIHSPVLLFPTIPWCLLLSPPTFQQVGGILLVWWGGGGNIERESHPSSAATPRMLCCTAVGSNGRPNAAPGVLHHYQAQCGCKVAAPPLPGTVWVPDCCACTAGPNITHFPACCASAT